MGRMILKGNGGLRSPADEAARRSRVAGSGSFPARLFRKLSWREVGIGAGVIAAGAVIGVVPGELQVHSTSSQVLEATAIGPRGTAWAVGWSCTSCGTTTATYHTLIWHWTGSAWSPVTSPNPDGQSLLKAVSAGPGGTPWAAGYSCTSG